MRHAWKKAGRAYSKTYWRCFVGKGVGKGGKLKKIM